MSESLEIPFAWLSVFLHLLYHCFYLCGLQEGLYYLILYTRKLSHWNMKGLQFLSKKYGQNCGGGIKAPRLVK